LLGYNCTQTIGWSFIFYKLVHHLVGGVPDLSLYNDVQVLLQVFQSLAVLEVVHALVGIVRSSVLVTLQQIFARMYITWIILYNLPPAQNSIGFPILLFAWSVTEMIRYSMYAVTMLTSPPYLLVWLRYTFFIIAYPMGLMGELIVSYAGRSYAQEKEIFAVTMPNKLNVTFHFPTVIFVFMVFYVIFFNPMYFHMFGQRKKVLGDKKDD